MKRTSVTYHFVGRVERGAQYAWRNAYTRITDKGMIYPWSTWNEAQSEAKNRGEIARHCPGCQHDACLDLPKKKGSTCSS